MTYSIFGIPPNYLDDFLKAWKEEFYGVELSWLEIEICRNTMTKISIGNLFDKLAEQYKMVRDLHQSKFYRVVNNLIDEGYLQAQTKGRSKIIKVTSKGIKEVGRLGRYLFEFQLERVKYDIWTDLINKITKVVGCLLEKRVVIIGPEYSIANVVARECRVCPARKDPLTDQIETYLSNLIFLNFNAIIDDKTQNSVIFELDEIDDWPIKKEYVDVVIELTGINSFENTSFLDEARRILKPNGYLIAYELTRQSSTLVSQMLRDIAFLQKISDPKIAWQIEEPLPTSENIKTELTDHGFTILDTYSDVVNTTIIGQKQIE